MESPNRQRRQMQRGTQDLAALAGLFCTDSVETNVLACDQGYGSVVVSALSMLGLLGMVKSTIKISLGLAQCRAAGFNLGSIREIFGYQADETPARGGEVECNTIDVEFGVDEVVIRKSRRYFDIETTPMVDVGSCFGSLHYATTINIGKDRVDRFYHHPVASVTSALLCSGLSSWLLLVVDAPWDLVKLLATVGLHLCLFLMLMVPLWFGWQTSRPGFLLNPSRLDVLTGTDTKPTGRFNLLQARVRDGNVLHLQGDTEFLQSTSFRLAAFEVSACTAIAYVCQYAILKPATETQAII